MIMPTAKYSGKAAVDRALAMVGKSYPVGWCQKFTNEIFQTGAVGDWDGDRSADAEDGWKKAAAKGKVVRANSIKNLASIPAATMLFWTGGSGDHGHAVVSVGNGQMVSTDLPTSGKIGKVSINMARDRWGLKFEGYATTEGNGFDLGAYGGNLGGGTVNTVKPGAIHTVNTKAGLYARKSPNGPNVIRNGKKLVRPHGFSVRVVKTQNSGGRSWAQGSGGLWYASQYLKKK
jgi:hypothetical protein